MRTNNSRVTNTYHAAAAVSPRVRFDFVTLILGFVLTAAVCIFTAASVVQGSTGGDPMTMVKNTVNQVMGILKDHQTSQEVRRRRLIQVVAGTLTLPTWLDRAWGIIGASLDRISAAAVCSAFYCVNGRRIPEQTGGLRGTEN